MFFKSMSKMLRGITYMRNEVVSVPYSIICSTISQTEEYHHFIPWCQKAQILQRISELENHTRLTINFNNLREISYTSHVVIRKEDSTCIITSICKDSPLNYLKSVWTINKIGEENAQVKYFLDFEFDSLVYQLTSSIFLNIMGKSMWDIFLKRAEEIKNRKFNEDIQITQQSNPLSKAQKFEKCISRQNNCNQAPQKYTLQQYLLPRPRLSQLMLKNEYINSQIINISARLAHTADYELKMNFQIKNMLSHQNISYHHDLLNEI